MIDTNRELRKKIAVLLRKFSMDPHHSPLKNQKDREIVGRFIDRLHSSEFDTGSLPYYSKNGLAKHSNKSECLFALVCDVVITYWRIVEAKAEDIAINFTDKLDGKLKRLETVYQGYPTLKILGDAKGYCLFASQRPDLLPKKEKKEADEGSDQSDTVGEAQVEYEKPDDGDMSLGEEQALRGGGAL